jgi:hypothetical protein
MLRSTDELRHGVLQLEDDEIGELANLAEPGFRARALAVGDARLPQDAAETRDHEQEHGNGDGHARAVPLDEPPHDVLDGPWSSLDGTVFQMRPHVGRQLGR